jgi:hypothetical protein
MAVAALHASPAIAPSHRLDTIKTPSEGLLEEAREIAAALRAPSYEQDSRWHDPNGSYATKPRALLDAAATALSASLEREGELRLAITGGEDAPGYNASLSHDTILKVLADNYASWKRDSEMAWDGETATAWKARALAAEGIVGSCWMRWSRLRRPCVTFRMTRTASASRKPRHRHPTTDGSIACPPNTSDKPLY